jgi:prepilin-type N-terminal cleavage/methylation domain-containing protein
MHRIWKALRDRRGFTLIEIAIVIAIIGILLLIALPLFTGARVRAYVAEARQLGSEWKALAWSCLVQKNFKRVKCDTEEEIGWTPPADSDIWYWDTKSWIRCNDSATVNPADFTANLACADETKTWLAMGVEFVTGTGITENYVLGFNISTGKTFESPATGEVVTVP